MIQQKKGAEAPWLFLLRGKSYPRQCLDCQCGFHLAGTELDAQTVDGYFAVSRCFCIYFWCLIYGHRLPSRRRRYLTQSILCMAHQKYIMPRSEPELRVIYFWWTIRALPPSLGFLRFEGITTIQLFIIHAFA